MSDPPPRFSFTRTDIHRLFGLLNDELRARGTVGDVYVVGGAVMCLAYGARESTRDVDAVFEPAAEVRAAAARVAAREGIPETWLNDAVKGFLGERAAFENYLELSHLKVFVARPEFVLAMKCASMRLGEEFHDVDDVRYLLRYLNVESFDQALELVTRYVNAADLPAKTRYVLEELLPGK